MWKEWNKANADMANGRVESAVNRLLGLVADLIEDARKD